MLRLWFLKRESELYIYFTSSYEGVYLKAESSNKNTEYGCPGGGGGEGALAGQT